MNDLGKHLSFFYLPTKVLFLSIKKRGLVELLNFFFNISSQKLIFVAPLMASQSIRLALTT